MTRKSLFMIAKPASALLAPAANAAKDLASKPLLKSAADRSKCMALKHEFKFAPEVTKVCLSCHTRAAKQTLNASNRRKST